MLPERSGTSARGEWHSRQFVIETQEQYPKHLCFEVFGADRLAQFNIQGGETITVSFDIDARQWQDKWFNSIKAWNITRPGQQQANGYGSNNAAAGQQASENIAYPPPPPTGANAAPADAKGDSSDLPF